MGCAGNGKYILSPFVKKSYPELLNEFKSCNGKGIIDSDGVMHAKLYFSFKSQRDSTFFQFTDLIGRKTLLMWVSPNSITARDLINNRFYNHSQIIDFLPFLKILDSNDITKIIWGVEPDFKNKIKMINIEKKNDILLKFEHKTLQNEKYGLTTLNYKDRHLGQNLRIDIKNRQRNAEYINMKKIWKMLEY